MELLGCGHEETEVMSERNEFEVVMTAFYKNNRKMRVSYDGNENDRECFSSCFHFCRDDVSKRVGFHEILAKRMVRRRLNHGNGKGIENM